jgi:hypothetical protein
VDRISDWNLPLKRATFGFSASPELKLTTNSSFNLQFDGNTTPYLPTGSSVFDKGYGALTIGVSHRIRAGQTPLLVQAYARENMNLPFRVRWNTDPDLAVGLKITINTRERVVWIAVQPLLPRLRRRDDGMAREARVAARVTVR